MRLFQVATAKSICSGMMKENCAEENCKRATGIEKAPLGILNLRQDALLYGGVTKQVTAPMCLYLHTILYVGILILALLW